jgi:hypothetical protein
VEVFDYETVATLVNTAALTFLLTHIITKFGWIEVRGLARDSL